MNNGNGNTWQDTETDEEENAEGEIEKSRRQAEILKEFYEQEGYSARIVKQNDGTFKVIRSSYSPGKMVGKSQEQLSLEGLIEQEISARERERIKAGVLPGKEFGPIRYPGKIPIKVTPTIAGIIGTKEHSRLVSAQEKIGTYEPILKEYKDIRIGIAKLQKERVETAKLIDDTEKAMAETSRESDEYSKLNEQLQAAILKRDDLQQRYELYDLRLSKLEKESPEEKIEKLTERPRQTVEKGGAYPPGARTAIAAVGRGEEILGHAAKYAIADVERGLRAAKSPPNPLDGMKRAIPVAAAERQAAGKKGYKYFGRIGKVSAPRITDSWSGSMAATGATPMSVVGRTPMAEMGESRLAQGGSEVGIALGIGTPKIAKPTNGVA